MLCLGQRDYKLLKRTSGGGWLTKLWARHRGDSHGATKKVRGHEMVSKMHREVHTRHTRQGRYCVLLLACKEARGLCVHTHTRAETIPRKSRGRWRREWVWDGKKAAWGLSVLWFYLWSHCARSSVPKEANAFSLLTR